MVDITPGMISSGTVDKKEAEKVFEANKDIENFKSPKKKFNKELSVQEAGLLIDSVKSELKKSIVGQEDIIHELLRGILCNGHVLVEGVPGIAKTLIILSLSVVTGCEAKRIQFTVDLLPADIIGIRSYTPGKGFETIKGPVFANFLIADEINRSPSKTQSAMLEAMQEKRVTIGRETYELPKPFFVMATQNPIETSGVYDLPEAQLDRFLFKLIIDYPNSDQEIEIIDTNITNRTLASYGLRTILNSQLIINMQEKVKKIYLSDPIKRYIVDIVGKTRDKDSEFAKYIAFGCSPRASIALGISSRAEALMAGRTHVLPQDVKKVAYSVLRHRLLLNYEAEADKVNSDMIIREIFKIIRVP